MTMLKRLAQRVNDWERSLHNRYTHDIDRLANRFESFMEEFSNILQRQAHKA